MMVVIYIFKYYATLDAQFRTKRVVFTNLVAKYCELRFHKHYFYVLCYSGEFALREVFKKIRIPNAWQPFLANSERVFRCMYESIQLGSNFVIISLFQALQAQIIHSTGFS